MVIQKQIETLEQEKFVLDGDGNVAVRTTAVLEAGDIEIGAVELKDSTTDTRTKIADGSTITTTDNALAVADANVKSDTAAMVTDLAAIELLNTDIVTATEATQTAVELIDNAIATDDSAQSATPAVMNAGAEYRANRTEYADGDATILQSDIKGGLVTAGYDDTLQINKTIDQAPLWSRYTDAVEIVSEQDLTAAYADFGSEAIDMKGYNRLGVYVIIDVNDSTDITLKLLGKHTSAGTDEFEIEGGTTQAISHTADGKWYYEFDVGTIPFIQLQAVADTVGATAGDLTISVDKKWRN